MESGSIAIKKNMSKIVEIIPVQHSNGQYKSIILYTGNGTHVIKVLADNIIGLDNLCDEAKDKTLVKITFDHIPYDQNHEFEDIVTYCGGVVSWFAYKSYTFHFDDDTCSTIELSYSSSNVCSPELEFIE